METVDTSSFLTGLILGFLLAILVLMAIWYAKWTWGLFKRPILVQKEVRETTRKSWQDFRGGARHGCLRFVICILLAFALLLVIRRLLIGG